MPSFLNANNSLSEGQELTSLNGWQHLVLESDGNLVLYCNARQNVVWQSGAGGRGTGPYRLKLQSHGGLEVQDATKTVVWASETQSALSPSVSLSLECTAKSTNWTDGADAQPCYLDRQRVKVDANRFLVGFHLVRNGGQIRYDYTQAALIAKRADGSVVPVTLSGETEGVTNWQEGAEKELAFLDRQTINLDGNRVLTGFGLERSGGNIRYKYWSAEIKIDNSTTALPLKSPLTTYTDWQDGANNKQPCYLDRQNVKLDANRLLTGFHLTRDGGRMRYEIYSKTFASPELTVHDNGNLTVTGVDGKVCWSSNTVSTARSADSLSSTGQLLADQFLRSANSAFFLRLYADGNLALYAGKEASSLSRAIWMSDTGGLGVAPYRAVMQVDGNWTLLDGTNTTLWMSDSANRGQAPYRVIMQDDGNLVTYDANNTPVWSSETHGYALPSLRSGANADQDTLLQQEKCLVSANHLYYVIVQADGNLAHYRTTSSTALWTSNALLKDTTAPHRLAMQGDGNLVLYDSKGKPTWASNTHHSGVAPYTLSLQDDGSLIIQDSAKTQVWTNGVVGEETCYFDLKTSSMLEATAWNPITRCDWNPLLQTGAVWGNQVGGKVDGTWSFTVPVETYYAVAGSCTGTATVHINGRAVLNMNNKAESIFYASVLLAAGTHTVRVVAEGADKYAGVALMITSGGSENSAALAAQEELVATEGEEASALQDYTQKQQEADAAHAKVQPLVSTDMVCKIVSTKVVDPAKQAAQVAITSQLHAAETKANAVLAENHSASTEFALQSNDSFAVSGSSSIGENASVSASCSGTAVVVMGGAASVSLTQDGLSVHASTEVQANASTEAAAAVQVDGKYVNGAGEVGASATGSLSATAGGALDVTAAGVSAQGAVEVLVKADAAVDGEVFGKAAVLGVTLVAAQAKGGASVDAEVYVSAGGEVSIGKGGVAVQGGAVAGASVSATAEGSASFDGALGSSGKIYAGAGVSIGAQVGLDCSTSATFEDGVFKFSLEGDVALLVGLKDVHIGFELDVSETLNKINAVLAKTQSVERALQEAFSSVHVAATIHNAAQSKLREIADELRHVANMAKKRVENARSKVQQLRGKVREEAKKGLDKIEQKLKERLRVNVITQGLAILGERPVKVAITTKGPNIVGKVVSTGVITVKNAVNRIKNRF